MSLAPLHDSKRQPTMGLSIVLLLRSVVRLAKFFSTRVKILPLFCSLAASPPTGLAKSISITKVPKHQNTAENLSDLTGC